MIFSKLRENIAMRIWDSIFFILCCDIVKNIAKKNEDVMIKLWENCKKYGEIGKIY